MKLFTIKLFLLFLLIISSISIYKAVIANYVPSINGWVKNQYGTPINGISVDMVDNARGGCLNRAICEEECSPECRPVEHYWYNAYFGGGQPRYTHTDLGTGPYGINGAGFFTFPGGSRNGVLGCGEGVLGIRFFPDADNPGSETFQSYTEWGGITDPGASISEILPGVDSHTNSAGPYGVDFTLNNGQNDVWFKFLYTPPVPSTPLISNATCNSNYLVSISWGATTNTDYYALYVWDNTTLSWKVYLDNIGNVTTYSFTGQSGHSYSAYVKAHGPGGWSADSAAGNFSCAATTPTTPPAPTVSATCAEGNNLVSINWQTTEYTDYYALYVHDKTTNTWPVNKDNIGKVVQYSFTGIAGHSYEAWLYAIGPGGTSKQSYIDNINCPATSTITTTPPTITIDPNTQSAPWIKTTGGDVHSNQ